MSALSTHMEKEAGQRLTPLHIFDIGSDLSDLPGLYASVDDPAERSPLCVLKSAVKCIRFPLYKGLRRFISNGQMHRQLPVTSARNKSGNRVAYFRARTHCVLDPRTAATRQSLSAGVGRSIAADAGASGTLALLLTTAFHDLLHLPQMVQVVSGIQPDKIGN